MKDLFRPNHNIKLFRSTSKDQIVPDHIKKAEIIENKLKLALQNDCKDINFFISGSFVLNTLFYMEKESNDIDIYPKDEDSKQKLVDLAIQNSTDMIFESDMAYTIECNGIKIQIVKKCTTNIEDLFKNFDITLCCVAYENSTFILAKSTCLSVLKNELDMNLTELLDEMEEENTIKRISTLFSRINKYAKRYNLKLTKNTYDVLKMMSEKIPNDYFHPKNGVVYQVSDSAGNITIKTVKECLWSNIYDHLNNTSENQHYDYFVEHLKIYGVELKESNSDEEILL